MKYGKLEIILGAIRRPDLALRFIRGKQPSEYDLAEVARHVHSCNPTIVEAGAFDGRDTRSFAQLWPTGHVYAFEPLPILANRVRANVAGLPNVTVIESAFGTGASDTIELFSFDRERDLHGSSSILPPGDHLVIAPDIKFDRKITVPATTIDDWHTSVGSPDIDLLWLDLQGAELMVLEHGLDMIRVTKVCHIEVSKQPLYDGGATFKAVREFFQAYGFKMKSCRIPVRSGNAIFVKE